MNLEGPENSFSRVDGSQPRPRSPAVAPRRSAFQWPDRALALAVPGGLLCGRFPRAWPAASSETRACETGANASVTRRRLWTPRVMWLVSRGRALVYLYVCVCVSCFSCRCDACMCLLARWRCFFRLAAFNFVNGSVSRCCCSLRLGRVEKMARLEKSNTIKVTH